MLHAARIIAFSLCALAAPCLAGATSLSVIPILLEAPGPAAITTVTLRNREPRPLNAQIRVFRWTQVDGKDRLEPTEDVVASPPVATISAGADYTVRVQRAAPGDIAGEEAYRVVIDELPNPNRQRNDTVAIVLRYLVPAFFLSPDATPPKLVWSLKDQAGATVLTASNSGDKRIQIVDLKLQTKIGGTLMVGKGLAGYVLGHSSKTWTMPGKVGRVNGGAILADSDHGPIHAAVAR